MIGVGMAKTGRRKPVVEAGAPTRERLERAGVDVDRGHHGVYTMKDAPLERALSRGAVTGGQYNAGAKFRHHWYHAGLVGGMGSIDLNRIFAPDLGSYSGMARSESQCFHRQRYREAVQAVGKTNSRVLEMVICDEQTLEDCGYQLGWGAKSSAIVAATERLRASLDDLCRLWGI